MFITSIFWIKISFWLKRTHLRSELSAKQSFPKFWISRIRKYIHTNCRLLEYNNNKQIYSKNTCPCHNISFIRIRGNKSWSSESLECHYNFIFISTTIIKMKSILFIWSKFMKKGLLKRKNLYSQRFMWVMNIYWNLKR
jgi:hypothetical protein